MKGSAVVSVASACLLQIAAASGPKGCCRSNQCLKAIGSPLNGGVADCSANLVVTVTAPPPSDVTTTTTATQTGVETARFTETVTQTASTETLSYSTSTTLTVATQTNTVTETITVPFTSTDLQAGPTVTVFTGTDFNYVSGGLQARRAALATPLAPVLALPTYAAAACSGSWDVYTSACRCAGVEPTTVTVDAASGETVTATVSTSVVGSTSSQTETRTASVTATTETTVTETVTETPAPATTTATEATTSTTVAQATAPPVTVVAPRTCQATGQAFRASSPDPSGSTRYMATFAEYGVGFAPGSAAQAMNFVLDSRGQLELAAPEAPATEVYAVYVPTAVTGTVQTRVGLRSAVDSMVNAGTVARIQGCIDSATSALSLRDLVSGKANLILCGNALYLSHGDGSDNPNGITYCRPMSATAF